MATRKGGKGSRGGTYAPEETRRLLLEAALKLFEENGYHATSVEQIVSTAGVTKGAFYYHFDNKLDVLLQIQDDYIDNRLRNCVRIIASTDDPTEQLRELILEALIGIDRYRAQVAIFLQERRFLVGERFSAIKEKRDAVDGIYEEVLRRGIEQGAFNSALSPRIAGFGILGMCAWAYNWYQPAGRLGIKEIADQLTSLVIDGVRPRP
ncbi:TetR/AcrR family transcriptional regulator [Streptomyces sp. GD-15H]|uniref:TetR family transcriptional regulator n=1 Tax=Streptomyces sp. GD-15H TaxID=3129112 RepID=UPI003251314F